MDAKVANMAHGFVDQWRSKSNPISANTAPNKPPVESFSAGNPTLATNRGGPFHAGAKALPVPVIAWYAIKRFRSHPEPIGGVTQTIKRNGCVDTSSSRPATPELDCRERAPTLQAVKGRNTCDGACLGATPTNRGTISVQTHIWRLYSLGPYQNQGIVPSEKRKVNARSRSLPGTQQIGREGFPSYRCRRLPLTGIELRGEKGGCAVN